VRETEHQKRVLVVGAGFGGLNAAKRLSGRGFDILLVDRNNYHLAGSQNGRERGSGGSAAGPRESRYRVQVAVRRRLE